MVLVFGGVIGAFRDRKWVPGIEHRMDRLAAIELGRRLLDGALLRGRLEPRIPAGPRPTSTPQPRWLRALADQSTTTMTRPGIATGGSQQGPQHATAGDQLGHLLAPPPAGSMKTDARHWSAEHVIESDILLVGQAVRQAWKILYAEQRRQLPARDVPIDQHRGHVAVEPEARRAG